MTAALERSAARPGRTLPPGKTRYPFDRTLGGPQGRSGRAKNFVRIGIRPRTVQSVAQSLYRLSYPAHIYMYMYIYMYIYIYTCMCVCVCVSQFKKLRHCSWMLTKSAEVYQFVLLLTFCHPSLSINVQGMLQPIPSVFLHFVQNWGYITHQCSKCNI